MGGELEAFLGAWSELDNPEIESLMSDFDFW